MLRLNKPVQTLLTTVALSLIASAVSGAAAAQVQVLDQVVAIVDDDIILASELQERVEGVLTMESRGVEIPTDDILIRETLDRLILDSIQPQLASSRSENS